MNDAPRRTLRELIARHGPGLSSDARRCEALLRDLCGAHRREINILVGAMGERVPLDLLAGRGAMPLGLLLARLARRLEDQLALTEGAARWAVGTWALALGVVSEEELETLEREAAESRRPTPTPSRPEAADALRTNSDEEPQDARPAPPPRQPQQKPRTPAPTPPPVARPTQTPTAPSPRTGRTTAPPVPTSSAPPPRGHAPTPAGPSAAQTHAQPQDTQTGGRGRSRRGCVVGCFLLVVMALVLFFGVPFVVSVLREDVQERSLEPPPPRTQ